MKSRSISKTTRSNFITYGIVIAAYLIMQALIAADQVSSLLNGLLVPLCILAVIFKREVILFLSEYEDPEQIELAASLFQFFIHYIVFVSISAVLMATLNSRRHFLTPALAPIVFSICVIISVTAFHGKWDIFSMALGVLSGGVAQILILH